jgi:uncharacterized protein YqgV (UPF0045/DUF77 family)
MTASGFLTVSPRVEGSMAPEIAKAVDALEAFDVRYETTAMGTLLEAEDAATLFAAAQGAHKAVDGDRVVTFLKIDDKRATDDPMDAKVDAVEEHLGREPRGGRDGDE